jgi:hypothetical protein
MRMTLVSIFILLAVLIGAQQALAMTHVFPDPDLPPVHPGRPDIAYYGQDLHATFPQGVIMNDPIHRAFTNIQRDAIGPDEVEYFDSLLDAIVDIPSMGMYDIPVTLSGPVETLVSNKIGNTTGVFATEIISMSLTGNIGGINIEVRESPSLQSLGQTSIVDLGGGLYEIDSFFDVFTELSVDGGEFMADTSGAGRMELCPEPATVCLFCLGGMALLRRRRA